MTYATVRGLRSSRQRIERLRGQFAQYELDGLLVTHSANITYLCSYPSRDSFLLIGRGAAVYCTDSRYTDEARAALPSSFTVERIDAANPFVAALKRACLSCGIKRLGFEERYVSVLEHRTLHDHCAGTIDLVPVVNLVEHLRQIKDVDEIAAIRAAVGITARVYAAAKRILKPGITELEAVGELERCIRQQGADGPSFDIIVAGGPNAAYPHHISGRRKLRRGEAVVLDMGVVHKGYRSDLTRVFFLGKINALVRGLYETVRQAQERAIALVRPGLLIADADAAARSFITERGYGHAFGHNLGHGVGLETHELPFLSGKSGARFEPGMVVTIEPGIYLPERCGIRIEDMVFVTGKKGEVLSGAIDK